MEKQDVISEFNDNEQQNLKNVMSSRGQNNSEKQSKKTGLVLTLKHSNKSLKDLKKSKQSSGADILLEEAQRRNLVSAGGRSTSSNMAMKSLTSFEKMMDATTVWKSGGLRKSKVN